MYNNKYFIFNSKINSLIVFGFLLFALFSCNPTKHVKPNELFLQKNKIRLDNHKIDKNEIDDIIKQKPNRKILGLFRFHLGVYNLFKEEGGNKIQQNIGEKPVIYDSLLTEKTIDQLKLYLNNRGYYDNEISYKTKIKKVGIEKKEANASLFCI